MLRPRSALLACLLLPLAALSVRAQAPAQPEPAVSLPPAWTGALTWRSIGPAAMGGRITAISVYEADPSTWWVATASGGLLRTTNNGVTFEHQFDREATVSIGDVCVAPSDRNIVWVGTGEANPRNSVSYGDGVYRSTDGGKSWKNMGLRQSFQVGRILVHPKNPDIVYVGALGRLWGPSEERGLYRTTDGGKTWERLLYVDDRTGVIDIVMHPEDPDTLLAATYERQRDGFDVNDPAKKWGPGSGLYRTTDGGKTWKKITQGLPACQLGRIGLCYYRKDPSIVYAIVESEKIGMGPRPAGKGEGSAYMGVQGEDTPRGPRLDRIIPDGPSDRAGLRPQDVIVQIEDQKVASYGELVAFAQTRKPGDTVKVVVERGGKRVELKLTFGKRPGGGGQAFDPGRPWGVFLGGQRANVQNMQGPDGFQYGGVYRSADGGETWARINSVNPRPMYFSKIRVDPADERYLYVLGIDLYRSSDGGRSFKEDVRGIHADQHALWIDPRDGRHMIVGTDGGFYSTYDRMSRWDHHNQMAIGQFYHVDVDSRLRYRVYGGLQDNGSWAGPSRTLTRAGPVNESWFRVGGGDGFVCRVDPADPNLVYFEMQNGGLARRNLQTGAVRSLRPTPPKGVRLRYNWKTPFLLSSHNSGIYYAAANYVMRSYDRGNNLQIISPEITRTSRGSATALAESPRSPNVLYVGSDDGALWVTRDGGKEWTNVTENLDAPGPRWVASIEASRFVEGRAYAVLDGHRSDDDEPYVLATEDFGKTWTPLRANLPWGSTRVLREDRVNADVLYLGTEFGIWVTLDRGRSWSRLNNNLPTVAVHEIAQHPVLNEIVAATHGRSLWVLDVSPLRQMKRDVLRARAHLFEPAPAIRWRTEPSRGGTNREFVGENPPPGAQIYYALAEKAASVELAVLDYAGQTVRTLKAETSPGLHRVGWDLVQPSLRRGQQGRPVEPAVYRVVLTVDGKTFSRPLRVENDPEVPLPSIITEDQLEEEEGQID